MQDKDITFFVIGSLFDFKETIDYIKSLSLPHIEEICVKAGLTDRQRSIIVQTYTFGRDQNAIVDSLYISRRTLYTEKYKALLKISDYMSFSASRY